MFELTPLQLQKAFLSGSVSAEAIVSYFYKRSEFFDKQTTAFLELLKDRSLEKARALDLKRAAGKPLGKLAGIPIAIKDNLQIKGERTTCASKFLENYKAPFDATVIQLIEEEDGLILGKTNLDEFAMGSSTENSAYGPTKNPWDLTCTPGGSSGGSAAAVSARYTLLSLGSDTGGSIRQPAALCGIVGFKPSYGRVSRYGLIAFASSLDQIGPFGTDVEGTATFMNVLAKPCSKDSTSIAAKAPCHLKQLKEPIKDLVVGVPWRFLEGISQEIRKNFEESLSTLKSLGCKIVEIDLDVLKHSIAVYYILATAEASTNLARFDGIRYGKRSSRGTTVNDVIDFSREEGFGFEVKRRIFLGTYVLSSGYQDAFYKKAQKVRTKIVEGFSKAFQECQIIATPSTTSSAFPLNSLSKDPLELYLQDTYTTPANLAGLPAISIPSGFCPKGKPLGLHLTGPQLQDPLVFQVAYHFETSSKRSISIPPLFHKEAP